MSDLPSISRAGIASLIYEGRLRAARVEQYDSYGNTPLYARLCDALELLVDVADHAMACANVASDYRDEEIRNGRDAIAVLGYLSNHWARAVAADGDDSHVTYKQAQDHVKGIIATGIRGTP